jgi:hypothetical protein
MEIFYIPFNPDRSHGWIVPIPRDGEKQFSSRPEAMAFARKLAKQEISKSGESSYLCVEGGDKMWRLFTPDLMPVN